MTDTLNVSLGHIRVAERFRREYGDIDALAESIEARGLLQPIGIDANYRLVFGERRLKAFQYLGRKTIPARIVHVDSILLAEHDENELRKDFTTSERVAIGQAIERELGERRGRDNQENFPEYKGTQTRDIAAEKAGFGNARTYQQAKSVVESGDESLVAAMDAGKVSVSAAADVATLPKDEQTEIVARGEKEVLEAAKQIRIRKAEARRAENERLRAETPPLPDGKYECIVIDPPWKMEKIERDVAPNQVAFEYPTMTEAELAEFDVPAIAADDCHLFCWTTRKHLPVALRLLESWGFRYVCLMVWHKPGGFQPFGLPQYNCEFVIYARRGSPSFIDTKAFNCCFNAARREHSRKPDEFYDVIRRVTSGPRIDVFSRESRDGFDVHGNETEKFVA